MSNPIVVYDACVLYPAGLRSALMYIGLAGIVKVRWSDAIHDEWIRNVLEDRKDIPREQLERTRRLMNAAIPESSVVRYEGLIEKLELPDPDDRHVLAAAIHAEAETIVTFNIRDFPKRVLAPYSIETRTSDSFVLRLLNAHPVQVVEALHIDRASKKRHPKSAEEYLESLVAQQLPRSSAALSKHLEDL